MALAPTVCLAQGFQCSSTKGLRTTVQSIHEVRRSSVVASVSMHLRGADGRGTEKRERTSVCSCRTETSAGRLLAPKFKSRHLQRRHCTRPGGGRGCRLTPLACGLACVSVHVLVCAPVNTAHLCLCATRACLCVRNTLYVLSVSACAPLYVCVCARRRCFAFFPSSSMNLPGPDSYNLSCIHISM